MAYSPSPGAYPDALGFIRFLSQRDVSLKIPINYVTAPGVALTAACFAHGSYREAAAATCLSNLLLLQFRRIVVDLYWDASRNDWNLCPVQLGNPNNANATSTMSSSAAQTMMSNSSGVASTTNLLSATTSIPSSVGGQTSTATTSTSILSPEIRDELFTALSASRLRSATLTPTAVTTSGIPVIAASNNTGEQIGPYYCEYSLDFDTLANVFAGFFENTETNINASSKILTLNLHAAASPFNLSAPAPAPAASSLPANNSFLGAILQRYVSVYLYDPTELSYERQNLNGSGSWFNVYRLDEPDDTFYTVQDHDSYTSSPNGWPDENFLTLINAQRLLVEFGSIDPQISAYNVTEDEGTIFPPSYLTAPREVTYQNDGSVSTGCFVEGTTASVEQANSSWATTTLGDGGNASAADFPGLFSQVQGLINCGISPILNETLNVTADQDFTAYQSFSRTAYWSWADGQPSNASAPMSSVHYNCGVLNGTSGHWQVADCTQSYYGACHNASQPYDWQISSAEASYDTVRKHCSSGLVFDAPQTALENSYLLAAWRQQQASTGDRSNTSPLLWVNINDRNVQDCWVIGEDTSCPFSQDGDDNNARELAVPSVAGVVVFFIVGLTLLVKCAGNRRNVRTKRRRGEAGWDYEGVPS